MKQALRKRWSGIQSKYKK